MCVQISFPVFQSSVQFDVRADVCVSGTSPESVSRLLEELAQYGTHYLRLSRFSLGSADKKGLVFQVMALHSASLTLVYVKDEPPFRRWPTPESDFCSRPNLSPSLFEKN